MVSPGQELFEVSVNGAAERFISLHDAQAWAKQQQTTKEQAEPVSIVRCQVVDPMGVGDPGCYELAPMSLEAL